MKFVIDAKPTKSGYEISINRKNYPVNYPPHVWQSFPKELHSQYVQNMAFVLTLHKTFSLKNTITYLFPPPLAESLFYYGLFLSMPENILDFETKRKTSDYVRFILNSHYHISFIGHPAPLPTASYKLDPKTALVPFTFGKDSLLTYALCKEMDIKPVPFFMLEPSNEIENKLKLTLMKKFKQEFGTDVHTFEVPLAQLKETKGLWWGWDIFLTQYTLHLLPYMYYHKVGYVFWSNEFEANEYIKDSEGFYLNDQVEQSGRWMQILNNALRIFGSHAKLGSLLEPLTELSILGILHNNFPKLGKYQASCLNDATSQKSDRWCGKCYECARVAISLHGLGINPKTIELNDNMLTKSKRDLFYVFESKQEELHSKFPFLKEEKLFAFYLAMKRGVEGDLIKEFKQKLAARVQSKSNLYANRYFGPYPHTALPQELESWLYNYYRENLGMIKKKLPL